MQDYAYLFVQKYTNKKAPQRHKPPKSKRGLLAGGVGMVIMGVILFVLYHHHVALNKSLKQPQKKVIMQQAKNIVVIALPQHKGFHQVTMLQAKKNTQPRFDFYKILPDIKVPNKEEATQAKH
ncbi:MAG: hypothetical protein JKY13_03070 [Gammaproteobacteria bacterium]|nr:hypothetical protein [Gammaproteobacteria bacterium]